jgi:excisionase family DNA binding protein
MSIEDVIHDAVKAAVAPMQTQVERLAAEVAALRRAQAPRLATVEEVAEQLGLSVSTVRRHVKDGSIPSRRIGRSIRVDVTALRPLSTEEVASDAWRLRHGDKQAERSGIHNQ